MSATPEFVIHTDGGSRGNPGPAAFAYVIERPGQPDIEEKGFLGKTTNNIAEYTGLVRALEHAQKIGARKLLVLSDSELMIRQMNGDYKVRHPGLLPLYEEADELRRAFDHVTFRHVRREHNKRADALCNEAMDEAGGASPARTSSKQTNIRAAETRLDERPDLEAKVREECLACLHAGAAAWAQGNPNQPPADAVWEQVWSIIVEAGVLRPRRK